VYPNPVVSNLHCTYYAMQNESVTIRIISASGNTVILKTMQVQQGYNTFTLDGTSLRPGLYILELHNGYDVQQVGFIKQ
jgi:adenylylsulfate kinase-like enzyme